MAELKRIDIITVPDAVVIGVKTMNRGGQNPVPALWERIFSEHTLEQLESGPAILDMYIGWMGEYYKETDTFAYIAGVILPAEFSVPDRFAHRLIPSCQVGFATISGSFNDGEVFSRAHEMTVEGICRMGFQPDYSYGWSAEAYPKDLSFDANNGTIHYLCPAKKRIKRTGYH